MIRAAAYVAAFASLLLEEAGRRRTDVRRLQDQMKRFREANDGLAAHNEELANELEQLRQRVHIYDISNNSLEERIEAALALIAERERETMHPSTQHWDGCARVHPLCQLRLTLSPRSEA